MKKMQQLWPEMHISAVLSGDLFRIAMEGCGARKMPGCDASLAGQNTVVGKREKLTVAVVEGLAVHKCSKPARA